MNTKDESDHLSSEQSHETHLPMLRWDDISSLVLAQESPCVTIYVPTSPVSNYREKNRILYKDQIKKVANALDARYAHETDKFLRAELIEKLETVGTTDIFWTHQQYGLAVFLSPERFMVRKVMTQPSDALGIVADSFHLRPALRDAANWMHYQVLCVSLHDVALYECNRENLSEVDLPSDVPRGMGDAFDRDETSANRERGERDGKDSGELKRYFRIVDEAIQNLTRNTKQPLVLAMVAEHQGLFREISSNPKLLKTGLDKEPFEEIRKQRLGQAVRPIAQQAMHSESSRWIEQYQERAAHGEGESAPTKIARAAAIGQIETLLIDEDARIAGTVDGDTGAVGYGAAEDVHSDDIIDAIAEHVIRNDGRVCFMPSDRMPTDTGVAAVLRYAMQP